MVAVVAALLYIPTRTNTSTIGDMATATQLAIAAMSLNLLLGYGGVISLGHSAFFGIGGYTTAILVSEYGWSQGWTIYVAAAIAFVVGCIVSLPALRLKGVYLALVTLALGVLFPTLVRWGKLAELTGGAQGISGIGYQETPSWYDEYFARWQFINESISLPELRGREGRAVFLYWVGIILLAVCYLVCRGHRQEPCRALAGRHPGQRDGRCGDGRQPGEDQGTRLRHLCRDVRRRRVPVRHPEHPRRSEPALLHAARQHHVPAHHGARRGGHAVGPDRRCLRLRDARHPDPRRRRDRAKAWSGGCSDG